MNESISIFDINKYIDYKTGQYIDSDNKHTFWSAASDYNTNLVTILENCFLNPKPPISKEPPSENQEEIIPVKRKYTIDDILKPIYSFNILTEEKFSYYGSYGIFNLILSARSKCNDDYLNLIFDSFKFYLNELTGLSISKNPDKVNEALDKLEKLKELLIRYYTPFCFSCDNEEIKLLIKEILYNLPYRTLSMGCYYSKKCKIEIYTQSIAEISDSPNLFNVKFWSTFAHEMFHALHHLYCKKNNTDIDHWLKDDSTSAPDENMIIPDIDNIFGQSFPSIVKESLASYFEYYSCIYGVNSTAPGATEAANKLRDEWMHCSPLDWPYAGAKAFLQDGETILDPGSLFKKVLETSAYDWQKARDIILSHCGC